MCTFMSIHTHMYGYTHFFVFFLFVSAVNLVVTEVAQKDCRQGRAATERFSCRAPTGSDQSNEDC